MSEGKNPHLTANDMSGYLIDEAGDAWQVVAYCSSPTVFIKRLRDGEEVNHAVDCLNYRKHGFRRLVPEGEEDGKPELTLSLSKVEKT